MNKHLRQSHKKRKEQYGSKDKRGQASNRASIDERPAIAAEKTRIGDWEVDAVTGQDHQGGLVTIVDLALKPTLVKKVAGKHVEVFTAATVVLPQPYLDGLGDYRRQRQRVRRTRNHQGTAKC